MSLLPYILFDVLPWYPEYPPFVALVVTKTAVGYAPGAESLSSPTTFVSKSFPVVPSVFSTSESWAFEI